MHLRFWIPAALSLVACAAEPASETKIERHVDAIPGRYIVVLDKATTIDEVAAGAAATIDRRYTTALHGFAARMTEAAALALADEPGVLYIEEDTPVHASTIQANPTWGLDRIDQASLPLDAKYNYTADGMGSTVYVIDTGINSTHVEFTGRLRVDLGATAIDDGNGAEDCNGHGTHVAGTVAGTTFGVAKKATLVPVRVLDCDGSGASSGVIAGMDFVAMNHQPRAVVNMSLGGAAGDAKDAAVRNLVATGVTVVVAAGNETQNACNTSPAREPMAITVASSTNTDARSSFSNYGSCVDLFAPGSQIMSAWIDSATATNTISGTSMASPHVAGVAALYLSANPNATPAQVTTALLGGTVANKITDVMGSPNKLLQTSAAPPGGGGGGGNVKITSPSDGAEVMPTFTVTIDAPNAARVDLTLDGASMVSDMTPPFAFSATNLTPGAHTLKAVATDSAGATAQHSIGIVVKASAGGLGGGNNPVPPPSKRDDGGGCSATSDAGGLWLGLVFIAMVSTLARRRRGLPMTAVIVLMLPLFEQRAAHAQYVPVDFSQQTFTAMNISASYQLSMLGKRPAPDHAHRPAVTTGSANVPRTLAASYPQPQRATAERSLRTLLESYPAVEAKLGVPRGDVGAAVAFFLVTCYEAARETTVDPAYYRTIIDQVHPLVTRSSAFAKSSPKERRTLYEQMAILGVLVAGTRAELAKHPDVAKGVALRDAARAYLDAFGIDAERLSVGDSGFIRG